MPGFSSRSAAKLAECDEALQRVFSRVVETFDCAILVGHRDKETQAEMFRSGKSKLDWPRSKHNSAPSMAIDVAPYPIDWTDRERFNFFAGFVLGVAREMGVELRWGGDWDGDWVLRDNTFDDLPHFELVP